ncbi:MAG: hypothetical protein MAG795_00822 [Candidatus Woesearchaeota archaeon]|nr:hypothetical protein [Candidatus Woesearchaeota archaeon]
MKKDLTEQISVFLLKQGYTVKVLNVGSFDILARKDTIFLIKVLSDANSLAKEWAAGMRKIASYINGVPLVIAQKAGNKLVDNVVYLRYGIYTINFQTFKGCIKKKLPIIKSTRAGYTACICGKKLKEKRQKQGYSINTLATKLGVSRKMIVNYEKEKSEITLKKALKLYDIFGDPVFEHINILDTFETESDPKSAISKKYLDLGFKATDTKRAPFNVIAKKKNDIILTEIGDKTSPELLPWARLLEVNKLVIFKKKKPKDIPSVTKPEFLELEKAKELIKFVKEFE